MRRAELLAQLFNAAPQSIAVGGTSGKSTTTGMIGWILQQAGRDPTIMNGAVMKNFITPEMPFASALVGGGDVFVSEVDESDGSIALFHPQIAVLNNISLDHKIDGRAARRCSATSSRKAKIAVLNLDNEETKALAATLAGSGIDLQRDRSRRRSCLRTNRRRRRRASTSRSPSAPPASQCGGAAADARAAQCLQCACGAVRGARAAAFRLHDAAQRSSSFSGIKRRFERVGAANGVTVIDDFAHNPDKIAATLATLHAFPGRLLVMFQPHGFGPLKLMKDAFIDCFART